MSKNEYYHKILYFYFQDYIFNLPESERAKFTQRGFVGKLKSILITIILSLKKRPSTSDSENCKRELTGRKWVFLFGKNNYEATKFLGEHDFVFVTDSNRGYKTEHVIHLLPVRRRLTYFFRFFSLVAYLRKKEGHKATETTDAIFSSLGWLEAFDETLRLYQPSVIVFSNDHSMVPRSLFYAAKKSGIPTVYIQHASISPYMPPLEFDLSLLEGQDALEKYKVKGIYGEVKLVGMPRFDRYLKLKRPTPAASIHTVGIAFNTVDSLEKIARMTVALKEGIPNLTIIIRPHPKDKRDFEPTFVGIKDDYTRSDPNKVSSFEFIVQCDLLIAGDSSIHLEAKMLNVESIYFDFSEEKTNLKDLYGYLEKGLVKEMKNETEVIDFIRNMEKGNPFESKAKFYNEALGSAFEGKSSGLALQEIESFLNMRT